MLLHPEGMQVVSRSFGRSLTRMGYVKGDVGDVRKGVMLIGTAIMPLQSKVHQYVMMNENFRQFWLFFV